MHFTFSLNSSMWSGVGLGNRLPSSTGFRRHGEQFVFFWRGRKNGEGRRGGRGDIKSNCVYCTLSPVSQFTQVLGSVYFVGCKYACF